MKTFNDLGYAVIKSAIPENIRDFVTQYALFDEMKNFTANDAQVPSAHSKYADPAMESMLILLHPLMEEHTGLKLHPTYSYYRVYRNNDKLDIHKDRPSCEISATLCFNFDYVDKDYVWPIWMVGKEVLLNPGDMLIYRGCDLDHWRDSLEVDENAWHVQGFFHYVNADGCYAEHKFDRRESLGMMKKDKNNQINFTGRSGKKYISHTE